jgi:hypothetical protein
MVKSNFAAVVFPTFVTFASDPTIPVKVLFTTIDDAFAATVSTYDLLTTDPPVEPDKSPVI